MDPVEPLPPRAEVVVVGAGFAGAATAWALAARGVGDVLVVEREPTAGQHASGRNAGLCRQLTDDDATTELTMRGARFLRQPPPGFSDGPLLARVGSLLVASVPATLARTAERAAAHGVPHAVVEPAAVVARWPLLAATTMAGAVAFPDDGVIDVARLLAGFVAGARRGGARFALGCAVRGFHTDEAGDDPGVVVDTDHGPVAARAVVIAAGAWAGPLGERAGAAVSLAPLRRHLFLTRAVPGLPADAPFVWQLDDELYARPESGGCLLSACDEEAGPPGDESTAPGAADWLAAKLARVAPAAADLAIARAWACQRTFAPDRRMLCGWDERVPWLFWVAGLGGHGATASAALGERAAAGLAARL